MITSINAEKACNKIQHSFMKNIHNHLRIEGNFLNIRKGTNKKKSTLISYLVMKD